MKNVIHRKQLPVNFPISFIGVIMLTLDRFQVPGWVWGSAMTVVLIVLICFIYVKSTENPIELQLEKLKGDKVDGNTRTSQQGFHS